jgi:hypothetical protein
VVTATMVVEIYDALRSIGFADDKAAKAADAMATLEPRFAAVRSEMQAMDLRHGADMRVLKWQVRLLFAATGPSLLLLLRVAAKLGAPG